MKVDISAHILPKLYLDKMVDVAQHGIDMRKRVMSVPAPFQLDKRHAFDIVMIVPAIPLGRGDQETRS